MECSQVYVHVGSHVLHRGLAESAALMKEAGGCFTLILVASSVLTSTVGVETICVPTGIKGKTSLVGSKEASRMGMTHHPFSFNNAAEPLLDPN